MAPIDKIQNEIETAYSAFSDMRDNVESLNNTIHSTVSKAINTPVRVGKPDDEDVANAIEEAVNLLEELV